MHSYFLYAPNKSNEQQSLFKNPHSLSCRRHSLRFLQSDFSLPHSRESATALLSERDESSTRRTIVFNIHFEYYLPVEDQVFQGVPSFISQTKIVDVCFFTSILATHSVHLVPVHLIDNLNNRIISSTNFNAQFLFVSNMFVTLLSSTCFEH